MSIDNASLNQKIIIRSHAYNVIPCPDLVMDMFAGEGEIINLFWSKIARRIIAIEKLHKKSTFCAQNTPQNVEVICGDNRDFVSLTSDADIIDCDAYGVVFPLIKQVVERHEQKPFLITFTDGSVTREWHRLSKKRRAEIIQSKIDELKPHSSYFEEGHYSRVHYGWMYFG